MFKGISPTVISLAVAILVLVILVVRARRLRVEYSLLWIFAAIGLLVSTVFYPAVEFVAPFLGVIYTPSAVFFLGIVFLLLVTFHLSVKLSKLENDRVRMAQKMALMAAEISALRGDDESRPNRDD